MISPLWNCSLDFISHFKKRFYLFLKRVERREKERDRNISVREKHLLVASCTCPDQGLNPQPRHVPWPGMDPVIFHFVERCPHNWVTLIRAYIKLFYSFTFPITSIIPLWILFPLTIFKDGIPFSFPIFFPPRQIHGFSNYLYF